MKNKKVKIKREVTDWGNLMIVIIGLLLIFFGIMSIAEFDNYEDYNNKSFTSISIIIIIAFGVIVFCIGLCLIIYEKKEIIEIGELQ